MHAFVQLSPVKFQFGFTRTACAYCKFLLSHADALSDQTGSQITQLSQLYLHLAFMALRALGKYIQDQHGSVNYPRVQFEGQVTHLRRAKIVIENNQRGFHLLYEVCNFLRLATTYKQGCIRALPLAFDNCGGFHPGRFCQQVQFIQTFGIVRIAKIHTNQNSGCQTRRFLLHYYSAVSSYAMVMARAGTMVEMACL